MINFSWTIMILAMFSLTPIENTYRTKFHTSEHTKVFLNEMIQGASTSNPEIDLAYKGVCQAMLAEHTYSPWSKWSYFNKGTSLVEESISVNGNLLENRYLRLLIQLNSPSFLGYNKNIKEDLDYILKNIKSTNQITKYWKEIFIKSLIDASNITKDQKQSLNTVKESL